jgi:hypothetical protein
MKGISRGSPEDLKDKLSKSTRTMPTLTMEKPGGLSSSLMERRLKRGATLSLKI